MSEPAYDLDPEDALRGVVNQLTIHGQRMPVIIPGSVIETLGFVSELVKRAQDAGYLPALLRQAMPWTEPLAPDELDRLATAIGEAAGSGDHSAERLAAVLREWRATAEIAGDPEAIQQIETGRAEIGSGDVVSGEEITRVLRSRRE
jgi:hypothetical protein